MPPPFSAIKENKTQAQIKNHESNQKHECLINPLKLLNTLRSSSKFLVEQFTILTGIAAGDGSRELAYLSTASCVGGLNFRVRKGSGCDTTAMAANVRLRS